MVVALGTVAWAGGALLGSQSDVARRPLVLSGLQMLVGGAVQLVLALALCEAGHLQWSAAATEPVAAAFVFGLLGSSVIGFTVYAWLLWNTLPTVANSSAYAAPMVATFLGWLILHDPVNLWTVVLAGAVLAGVALLIWAQGRGHPRVAEAAAARGQQLSEAA